MFRYTQNYIIYIIALLPILTSYHAVSFSVANSSSDGPVSLSYLYLLGQGKEVILKLAHHNKDFTTAMVRMEVIR
jgi:hypothetical protein